MREHAHGTVIPSGCRAHRAICSTKSGPLYTSRGSDRSQGWSGLRLSRRSTTCPTRASGRLPCGSARVGELLCSEASFHAPGCSGRPAAPRRGPLAVHRAVALRSAALLSQRRWPSRDSCRTSRPDSVRSVEAEGDRLSFSSRTDQARDAGAGGLHRLEPDLRLRPEQPRHRVRRQAHRAVTRRQLRRLRSSASLLRLRGRWRSFAWSPAACRRSRRRARSIRSR